MELIATITICHFPDYNKFSHVPGVTSLVTYICYIYIYFFHIYSMVFSNYSTFAQKPTAF
jgi:hypothetical protein